MARTQHSSKSGKAPRTKKDRKREKEGEKDTNPKPDIVKTKKRRNRGMDKLLAKCRRHVVNNYKREDRAIPFKRLSDCIRACASDVAEDHCVRFAADALSALQHATEDIFVESFEKGRDASIARKGKSMNSSDFLMGVQLTDGLAEAYENYYPLKVRNAAEKVLDVFSRHKMEIPGIVELYTK
jgi:histone H3/H4